MTSVMPKPPAAFSPLIDDEIELPIGNQRGQPLGHDGPPGAADNVADKKNTHTLFGLAEIDHFSLR